MTDKEAEILKWKKRYQREKSARAQAEKLLEEKSSQLYSANSQLENRVLEESTKFKREEKKFTALFQSSKDGIVLYDEAGEIIDVNQTISDLLRIPIDNLVGRHITEMLPDRSSIFLKRALLEINKKGGTRFECNLRDSHQQSIPVEISATRFHYEQRTIVQGIIRDITANRQAAKELKLATNSAIKANEAKSLFLATMSHEIRTPLNGIIGFTDLLLQSELTDEHKQHLKLIKKSGDILLNVINDILDFSRTESGLMELEKADYSLVECIEDSLDIHSHTAATKKIDLLYSIDPNISAYQHGDSGRLKQVLLNLISNALKFTETGAVTIEVTKPNSEYIQLEITDTGIGFDEEIKLQLFQPFLQADASTTRKYGGTGLGLAICKQLMEAMGGSISASSTLGRGSKFTLVLPCIPALNHETSSSQESINLQNHKILIVDDNQINLDFMQARLKKWGADVTTSIEPENALTLLSQMPQEFDLLLIDMLMPDIDGFEFAKKLRHISTYEPPPMLLITSSREMVKSQVIDLGYSNVIYKPVKEASLQYAIKSVLKLNTPSKSIPLKKTNVPLVGSVTEPDKYALIVEDNGINAKLAKLLLERLGIKSDIAHNGQEALYQLEKQTKYDIIFMDMQMPVMDGLEATKRIRADHSLLAYRETPIIAMTANVLPEDEARCLVVGMNGYVTKPIDVEVIKKYLAEYNISF